MLGMQVQGDGPPLTGCSSGGLNSTEITNSLVLGGTLASPVAETDGR